MIARSMILIALAACRVPDLDLDGKHCPCASGYTCDTATDTCIATGGGDAGGDAPLPACFTTPPGAALFTSSFTGGGLAWTEPLGNWGVQGGEAVQSDDAAALAYAYPPQTAAETDYRITAKLRQDSGAGTDSLGLVLRVDAASTGHYGCTWEPNTGRFSMVHTSTDGTMTSAIDTVLVDLASIPDYMASQPQIMDAEARGSSLECCLRDVPTAHLVVTDTRYVTGGPGFRTASMSAAFDDISINAVP